jgi:hypothetical protein
MRVTCEDVESWSSAIRLDVCEPRSARVSESFGALRAGPVIAVDPVGDLEEQLIENGVSGPECAEEARISRVRGVRRSCEDAFGGTFGGSA